MRKSLFLVVSETYIPLRSPIQGNVTGSDSVPIAVWLHIYLIGINISRKKEAEIQKKYLKLLYMRKSLFLIVSETYFPLRGPIPDNVTGSNRIPFTVWLYIYLINISRK